MPKIKIIWTQTYTDEYDTHTVMRGVPEGDFEEISDADYDLLRRNLHRIPRQYGFDPCIVKFEDVPIRATLATVTAAVRKQEADQLAEKHKKEQLQKKKKQRAAERERERYLAMKKKFESSGEE